MTIEVIERGEAPQDRQFEVKCHRCRSLLKFKRSDAGPSTWDRGASFCAIACPVCAAQVTVTE